MFRIYTYIFAIVFCTNGLCQESEGGVDLGGGGLVNAAEWYQARETIRLYLDKIQPPKKNQKEFERLKMGLHSKYITETEIEFVSWPLALGHETPEQRNPLQLEFTGDPTPQLKPSQAQFESLIRHAINFKRSSRGLIRVSTKYSSLLDDLEKYTLVIHEYLGLLAVPGETPDKFYAVSNYVAKKIFELEMRDRTAGIKGLEVFIEPGTTVFIVPAYKSLTVEIWGAGGGGGASGNLLIGGEDGEDSRFGSVRATGGHGGNGGYAHSNESSGGKGGLGKNGDDNQPGLEGDRGKSEGGRGAGPLRWGRGGAGGHHYNGPGLSAIHGYGAGGGGGGGDHGFRLGGYDQEVQVGGGGGGSGGYSKKTYVSSARMAPGRRITIVVGAGGSGGQQDSAGGNGGNGRVEISWR